MYSSRRGPADARVISVYPPKAVVRTGFHQNHVAGLTPNGVCLDLGDDVHITGFYSKKKKLHAIAYSKINSH